VGARDKIAAVTRHPASRSTTPDREERAALVGLFNGTSRHFDPEHSLDELAGLASAAGASVVLRVLQERPKPDPATFLGSGKVDSLAVSCDELDVDIVIFDNELTPAQLRNLENAWTGWSSIGHSSFSTSLRAARERAKASCRSSLLS
jgi:GTP-binding protein HflX